VKELRSLGKTVAVVAVDPSSPFSGGAILGDRVRMSDLSLDEGVYIRSMGSRGTLGGLSAAAYYVVTVLDACGFDYVFIETVGVGQAEVEIMQIVDTTLVVLVTGLGDDIQAIKAGILEIGQIFVINKADREGASRLELEIKMMLELNPDSVDWNPPVLLTSAVQNLGINEVIQAIFRHREELVQTERWTSLNRERLKRQLMLVFEKRYAEMVKEKFTYYGNLIDVLDAILAGQIDIKTIVDKNIDQVLKPSAKELIF
jgi:LAO/AO transport system kinase